MNIIKITTTADSITNPKPLNVHGLYSAQVSVARTSGIRDIFVVISKREIAYEISALIETPTLADEVFITLRGELRSRNENGHLYVYMWVTSVQIKQCTAAHTNAKEFPANAVSNSANAVELTGTICTDPTLRKTPNGFTISDAIIAVQNAAETRTYYLPIIAWGSTAHELAELTPGTDIALKGRFQSRTYSKNDIANTSYEVSANELHATHLTY